MEHRRGEGALSVVLGGTASVHCVHDRKKREVVTEERIAELGAVIGVVYQRGIHHLHMCSCCENLFVATQVEPTYCDTCLGATVHPLGGPIAEPKGVVA